MKWLKHYTDTLNNSKIKRLVHKHGMEGYGIYFGLLEKIGIEIDKNQPKNEIGTLPIDYDIKIIARDFYVSVSKLEKIITTLTQLNLLDKEPWEQYKIISCVKLVERADDYTAKLLKENSEQTTDLLRSDSEVTPKKVYSRSKKQEARSKKQEINNMSGEISPVETQQPKHSELTERLSSKIRERMPNANIRPRNWDVWWQKIAIQVAKKINMSLPQPVDMNDLLSKIDWMPNVIELIDWTQEPDNAFEVQSPKSLYEKLDRIEAYRAKQPIRDSQNRGPTWAGQQAFCTDTSAALEPWEEDRLKEIEELKKKGEWIEPEPEEEDEGYADL